MKSITTSNEAVLPFRVDMICCGRDHGSFAAPTWAEADEFRERWCTYLPVDAFLHDQEGGHERRAVIRYAWEPRHGGQQL